MEYEEDNTNHSNESDPPTIVDLENPPTESNHEDVELIFTNNMETELTNIRNHFLHNAPNQQTIDSHVYFQSNSPLTISCSNSDCEDNENKFKEITMKEFKQSLDKYYDDVDKYSNELDILITYMKGQKNLFIQSYLLCQRNLNLLMIPCILITASVTIFAPLYQEEDWTIGLIAGLNALAAILISLVNYFKLETSTQTFYNTAGQYDKLETSLEFVASKIMIMETQSEKSAIIFEKLQEVETKIQEIKEWNQLFIPDTIRGIFPIICHINIFSFIKRIEGSKKSLITRLKDIKNEIRYIVYRGTNKHNQERIEKRLNYLSETKDKIKEELLHYRNAYSYIDELFTIEIKNARNTSLYFCYRNKPEMCNSKNPVVDRYVHCLASPY